MNKTKLIWLNGRFIPWDKANVHILNHSLHYGSGVFEGIRFYNTQKGPAVFRLDEHIKRFFVSAEIMGMEIPYSAKQLKSTILDLIRKNKIKDGYIRPIAFYGSRMGLDPRGAEINIAIACWGWGKYLKKDIVKVFISSYRRIHPNSSKMEAKISGHYFNSILASLEAKENGFDEALLLDYKGNIAEGPGENIFFAKNGKIYTPLERSILPGITRETIKIIARDLKYAVIEKKIRPADLKKMDEAFFTGTAVEINAIGQIGKVKIGKGKIGKITEKLKEKYYQAVRGKLKKYNKWLSYVNK